LIYKDKYVVAKANTALTGATVCFSFLLLITGCGGISETTETPVREDAVPVTLVAKKTQKPLVIDGELNESVWENAIVYQLDLSTDYDLHPNQRPVKRPGTGTLKETGTVQLAWDDNYLYVGVKFHDSDIVQESDENQQHHYTSGDLLEIFLKPENSSWYWEIYGTPNEKKTAFWFPGRGRLGLKSGFDPGMPLEDIRIATRLEGTLNNWRDRDGFWTAEMAIPVQSLTAHGDAFGPGSKWRILVARYNFSRYLPWKELSMVPRLSTTNFHLLEEFGVLEFEPQVSQGNPP